MKNQEKYACCPTIMQAAYMQFHFHRLTMSEINRNDRGNSQLEPDKYQIDQLLAPWTEFDSARNEKTSLASTASVPNVLSSYFSFFYASKYNICLDA
jgi:hypothetical protein